jgi:hypothetical protein
MERKHSCRTLTGQRIFNGAMRRGCGQGFPTRAGADRRFAQGRIVSGHFSPLSVKMSPGKAA